MNNINNVPNSFSELCHNIDWEELRIQRRALIDTQAIAEDANAIEGLINLVEVIMDTAVDKEGIPFEIVFGPEASED